MDYGTVYMEYISHSESEKYIYVTTCMGRRHIVSATLQTAQLVLDARLQPIVHR